MASIKLNLMLIILMFSQVLSHQLSINTDKNSSCNVNFLVKENSTINIQTELPIFQYASLHSVGSNSQYTLNENIMKQSSILYGLLSTVNKNDLNELCYNEMQVTRKGIHDRNIWAIKALDASGTQEAGFLWGHNFWLGSRQGCETVKTPLKITLSSRYRRDMKENLLSDIAPFDFDFRVIHGRHNSPWQVEVKFLGEGILHLGICLPKSCTNEEIKNVTQKYFDSRHSYAQNLFEFSPQIFLVKDLNLRENFSSKLTVKIFIAVMTITFLLIGIGYYNDSRNIDKINNNSDSYVNANLQQTTEQSINDTVNDVERIKELKLLNNGGNDKTTFEKIVKCFSLRDNFKWLIKTDTTPASIPLINGLRAISCFWILSFHVNWFMHFTVDNESMLFAYAEKFYFLYLSNAPILVDVFFTISGLLLSYNFLKNKNKIEEIKTNNLMDNTKLFGRQLLQRYVRLSSLYFMVLVMSEILTTYIVDVSQFHVHDRNDLLCEKYWWRNIFYIQNLFHADDLCVNWTWSLACEMQFFLIFTTILFIYAKNPTIGKKLFIGCSVGFFLLSLSIAFYKNFTTTFDVLYETGTLLYISPWGRIHPYYVGVYSGWYLYEYTQTSVHSKPFTKKQIRNNWIIASTIIVVCLHATFTRNMPVWFASTILSTGRIIFASAFAWMIISSATGNGNWFTRFLECRPFVHLNKVSYAIYLLNPITITTIYGLRDNSSHTDIMTTTVMTCAMIVIVYGLSVISSLLFEIPYNKLSDEFLRPQIKKKIQ